MANQFPDPDPIINEWDFFAHLKEAGVVKVYKVEELVDLDCIGDGAFGSLLTADAKTDSCKVILHNLMEFENLGEKKFDFLDEELRIKAELSHPNVLKFLGIFLGPENTGFSSLVTEYCDGELLSKWFENDLKQLENSQKLQIAKDIVAGTIYLKEKRVSLIEAMNPMNIWIHNGRAKIAYLKFIQRSLDHYIHTVNTYYLLKYTDPQYVKNPKASRDENSVIFALGVIFAELAGASLYDFTNKEKFILDIYEGRRDWSNARAPADFIQLAKSCCAQDPKKRPNLKEVEKSLEQISWTSDSYSTYPCEEQSENVKKIDTAELTDQQSDNTTIPDTPLASTLFALKRRLYSLEISPEEISLLENTLTLLDKYTRLDGDDQLVFSHLKKYWDIEKQSEDVLINILLKFRFLPECACLLGFCYSDKIGLNIEKAIPWYRVAGDGDDPFALNQLGYCYSLGAEFGFNRHVGNSYYQKSADMGHPQGKSNLAHTLRIGEQDSERAFQLYQEIADTGYLNGQFWVGYCFMLGIGTERNPRKAYLWFERCDKESFKHAKIYLTDCHDIGIGTLKDKHKALLTCLKAKGNENVDMIQKFNEMMIS
ncbi:hypothetical protein G9A89_021722 [Geosiphon pyriformis]|nr:hypothetical protein G9A89_021722 [Geosiphon pyriformis]